MSPSHTAVLKTVALAKDAEQKTLGADVAVVQEPGFLPGKDQHLPSLWREAFEHAAIVGVGPGRGRRCFVAPVRR